VIDNLNGVNGRLALDLNDNVIWNKQELVAFLAKHQGGVIDLEIAEGACLRSLGLFDLLDAFNFRSITIRSFNLVQEPYRNYKLQGHALSFRYFNVPPEVDYTPYHQWTGKHIFGALYNRPTWSRIGLASHLQVNHSAATSLNFRFNPHDPDQRGVFELDQLFAVHPESIANFGKIYSQLPVQLEEQDSYTMGGTAKSHTDQLAQFYSDFLIDVVAETFLKGRSFYPTEKTTRPMLLKKPFILMGPKCFLIHLRQMGFKTFHDFWDEDYDGYGMKQRYTQILDLIDSIAKKTETELQYMYKQMQPILEHNHQLLLTKQFTREITYVE
jgi:hypothetical protein